MTYVASNWSVKILKDLVKVYLNFFVQVKHNDGQAWHHLRFVKPRFQTTNCRYTFSFGVINCWNMLQSEKASSDTVNSFEKSLIIVLAETVTQSTSQIRIIANWFLRYTMGSSENSIITLCHLQKDGNGNAKSGIYQFGLKTTDN